MLDYEKTGQLIQQRRRELNITQRELAERLGVTDRAVSKWETGKSFPDVAMLKPLAEALGVSVGELLDGQLRESDAVISAEEAGETALRGIRMYARQNIRRHRVLLGILAVLLVLLGFLGLQEYEEYRHRPLNFQEDDLTFGDLIFHEEDGTEYRWELDDAFGQELRGQIIRFMQMEMEQGVPQKQITRFSREKAAVELEGLITFYDEAYYDHRSGLYYKRPMSSATHWMLTHICRELIAGENYAYTGERHFNDGLQTLDINCELTEPRMEAVVTYLNEKIQEPEGPLNPDVWVDYAVENITRLTPEQYLSAAEFQFLQKEIDYRDYFFWHVYDVELTTWYTREMEALIPQYPDGECHLLVLAAGNSHDSTWLHDQDVIWHYYPEYEPLEP